MSTPLDDPLGREHAQARGEVAKNRKVFATSQPGALATAFREAMRLVERMRADGASETERFAVLEQTLVDFWPKGRTWRYLCGACRDTGLVIHERVTNRLGVVVDEGVPCHCGKGQRFRDRPRRGAEDFTAAGKVSKPSGFTRFSR